MQQDDIWGAEAARTYDTPGTGMFAPEVLEPAVERLAQLAAGGRALEFAIGTGRIAVPLSQRNVPVASIEFSPAMIAELRAKVDEATIPVVLGDMATAVVPGRYSLVYLVYNTISNLLTQAQQVACFRNAARHLSPGGRFVIELWVPELRKLPPGQQAVVWQSEAGYIGLDTYDVLNQQVVSPPCPVRRGQAGRAVPLAASLHLAGGTRPDGAAGRLRARKPAYGLGRGTLHGGVALARLRLSPARLDQPRSFSIRATFGAK